MVEASSLVFFTERVVQLVELFCLFVVGRRIVGIDRKDLLSKFELFEHLLECICHRDTCVRLKRSISIMFSILYAIKIPQEALLYQGGMQAFHPHTQDEQSMLQMHDDLEMSMRLLRSVRSLDVPIRWN